MKGSLKPSDRYLYFGRDVPAGVRTCFRYPGQFRNSSLTDWQPLTADGLVPIGAIGFYPP